MRSNCDGCAQGLEVRDGLHYRDGKPWIGCTASQYPADPAPPSVPGPRVGTWSVINPQYWECGGVPDPVPEHRCYRTHAARIASCWACKTLRPPLPASDAPTPEPCRDCLTVGGHKHDCAGYADEFARLSVSERFAARIAALIRVECANASAPTPERMPRGKWLSWPHHWLCECENPNPASLDCCVGCGTARPLDAPTPAGEREDEDRCHKCGRTDSCCVSAIGAVGFGIPLDIIGVGEDAATLYTGECVRKLLDRAALRAAPRGEPSEVMLDWLAKHSFGGECVIVLRSGPFGFVQRVNQSHQVEWRFEGGTLRESISHAMHPTLGASPDAADGEGRT